MARPPKTPKLPCCPECVEDIPGTDPYPNLLVICPSCLAIVIYDSGDKAFRTLRTEEWWPIHLKPEFANLCDRRMVMLDELTAPKRDERKTMTTTMIEAQEHSTQFTINKPWVEPDPPKASAVFASPPVAASPVIATAAISTLMGRSVKRM